jgi:hypothetical protein
MSYAASAPTLQCAPSESTNCASTPPKVLLLGRHGKQHAFTAHVSVKSLDIGNSESQFNLPSRILVGSRMESKCGFARYELAPSRRLELQFQTEHIAVELHTLPMSATNLITYLSWVPCMCPPINERVQYIRATLRSGATKLSAVADRHRPHLSHKGAKELVAVCHEGEMSTINQHQFLRRSLHLLEIIHGCRSRRDNVIAPLNYEKCRPYVCCVFGRSVAI